MSDAVSSMAAPQKWSREASSIVKERSTVGQEKSKKQKISR